VELFVHLIEQCLETHRRLISLHAEVDELTDGCRMISEATKECQQTIQTATEESEEANRQVIAYEEAEIANYEFRLAKAEDDLRVRQSQVTEQNGTQSHFEEAVYELLGSRMENALRSCGVSDGFQLLGRNRGHRELILRQRTEVQNIARHIATHTKHINRLETQVAANEQMVGADPEIDRVLEAKIEIRLGSVEELQQQQTCLEAALESSRSTRVQNH